MIKKIIVIVTILLGATVLPLSLGFNIVDTTWENIALLVFVWGCIGMLTAKIYYDLDKWNHG